MVTDTMEMDTGTAIITGTTTITTMATTMATTMNTMNTISTDKANKNSY
jgi:hypothetical protein